jgi:hypothetical protein
VEKELLPHAMESPSTMPLHELLTQNNNTLLAVSDGGADEDKSYGSFGWVLGTD